MNAQCSPRAPLLGAALAVLVATGCLVGPDYKTPDAPTAESWMDPGDPDIERVPTDLTSWWRLFDDPVLNHLVQIATQQNLTLVSAAVRVLQAQAVYGIAYGLLFPQQQFASGQFSYNRTSERTKDNVTDPHFHEWSLGLGASWELDIFGKFRRGIEAADAEILATVATYDDVLVSLIAQVATTYIQHRTLSERLAVARSNVTIQARGLEIAQARFEGGTSTELDSAQATSLLRDTESQIPSLQATLEQTENALCTLLGLPPQSLHEILGDGVIPLPPAEIQVGIPADLLRRRPDIRRSERQLAAQSARIGIAESELYPAFSLFGSIGFVSEAPGDLFNRHSLQGTIGPAVSWPVLNYGRLENAVRVEDAAFQALVADYQDTVLRAQEEVQSSIAGFLGAQRQAALLGPGVQAASRAVEIAELQYRGGTADYTRVLDTQQLLLQEQDRLVSSKGFTALNLVNLYRSLGGGWEIREGQPPIPTDVLNQMRARGNWGDLLPPHPIDPTAPEGDASTGK